MVYPSRLTRRCSPPCIAVRGVHDATWDTDITSSTISTFCPSKTMSTNKSCSCKQWNRIFIKYIHKHACSIIMLKRKEVREFYTFPYIDAASSERCIKLECLEKTTNLPLANCQLSHTRICQEWKFKPNLWQTLWWVSNTIVPWPHVERMIFTSFAYYQGFKKNLVMIQAKDRWSKSKVTHVLVKYGYRQSV